VDGPVAIVLAAGEGRRMQSDLPKVLHEACGRPLVDFVLDSARDAGADRLLVVVGYQAPVVQQKLKSRGDVEFALQAEQLGTGHAVMICRESLAEHQGPVLVLNGDMPLIRARSLARLLAVQQEQAAACVVGTARTEANAGLGRIVRDEEGGFERIVEEADATPEEAKIEEINTGCFVFDGQKLWEALDQLRPNNRQGQFYLTDCAEILRESGHIVVASCTFEIEEAMGVNTPEQLSAVEAALSGP